MPQPQRPVAGAENAERVDFGTVVRELPKYLEPGTELASTEALERATPQERDATVPGLIGWLSDERPRVRGMALLYLNFVYLPPEGSRTLSCDRYLPAEDVPVVAARLRDADSRVRHAAFLALNSVERCGHGLEQLVALVLPMLHAPDILIEYPDPFFVESDKRMRATMTPAQQAALQAHPRPVIKLPAEGPVLLSIPAAAMLPPRAAVDEAMIAFLDRPDQTKSTLAESLHTLALSHASERVNDEVLRRVFEQKAMTVYLLQFVTWLRLTPAQVVEQKQRLLTLSQDPAERPVLRRVAVNVAACWTETRSRPCQPSSEDFREDNAQAQSASQPASQP